MVKNLAIMVITMLVLLFLVGCGLSEQKISNIVSASLQKSLNSDPQYMELNLKLKEFKIVEQNNNSYQGIATIEYAKALHEVHLDIIVDGSKVTWDLKPGSLSFIPR